MLADCSQRVNETHSRIKRHSRLRRRALAFQPMAGGGSLSQVRHDVISLKLELNYPACLTDCRVRIFQVY